MALMIKTKIMAINESCGLFEGTRCRRKKLIQNRNILAKSLIRDWKKNSRWPATKAEGKMKKFNTAAGRMNLGL
jgi:hypothetical protein